MEVWQLELIFFVFVDDNVWMYVIGNDVVIGYYLWFVVQCEGVDFLWFFYYVKLQVCRWVVCVVVVVVVDQCVGYVGVLYVLCDECVDCIVCFVCVEQVVQLCNMCDG